MVDNENKNVNNENENKKPAKEPNTFNMVFRWFIACFILSFFLNLLTSS